MTTISGPSSTQNETKAALLAYLDALALAEPIQSKLWQLAEITLPQVTVLRELRNGPRTAGKLGQTIGLSATSITRLIDRLERRGMVSRHRDSEDRRVVEIHLEPAAERLLGETKVFRGSNIHLAVEAMTNEERRELTSSLRRLVEIAREIATEGKERE